MNPAADKPRLTPKLRFPEFRDKPGWEPVSLGSVSVPVVERVGDRQLTPVSISAGTGFVPQAEKFGRDISGTQYRLYTLVRDGDFVYNKGNSLKFPQGCVYQLHGWGEVAAPNVFICFRLKPAYSDGFFQQCFEKNLHGVQLKKHITSGARSNGLLNISKEDFFSVKIPTPFLPEQRKIAACLSSLDDLIRAEGRKLDALKAHKKGLLRNLFPRDGETRPRLRFPEFRDAGEWVTSPLLKFISSLDAGVSVNSGDRPAEKGESGILKTSAVTNGVFNPMQNKVVSIDLEQARLREPVTADTIIISRMNTPALVGANAYVEVGARNLFLPDRLWAAKPRANVSMRFLSFILGSDRGRALLSQLATGTSGSMKNITKPDVLALPIVAPSLSEQHRIASCLSSLENLIESQVKIIDTLKTHKKGLMQKLFPLMEEAGI